MSDAVETSADVQQIEDKQLYVGSTINGAFERIENPKADPPIQPEIQLIEGWRNGNIKLGTSSPAVDATGHDWDIYLVVPDVTGWQQATEIWVKRP